MGLPPRPMLQPPTPSSPQINAGPIGAESSLPLPGGFSGEPMPASSAVATSGVAPKRKPLWQVQAEAFVEVWLPRRSRIAAGVALAAAVVTGFGAAAGAGAALAGESSTARTLLVRSSPPGASVTLDDERLDGVTPLIVDANLADGPHTLKVALAAGAPAQRKLALSGDDRFVLVSESLQSSGKVLVQTRPGGARVLLDGRDVGAGPVTLDSVTTDKPHVIEARKAGYKNATATVPVERPPDHVMVLSLEPVRPPGRVVIQSALPASVIMDGMPWGSTSSAERECPSGRHELTLRVNELGLERRAVIDVPERALVKYFVAFD